METERPIPPSTKIETPVMKPARSEARKTTALATSSTGTF